MKTILAVTVFALLYSCSPKQTISSNTIGQVVSSCKFSNDNGESFGNAVLINGVQSQRDGFAAEYHYISDRFGNRGKDWFLIGQTLLSEKEKIIDVVEIQLQNPAERKLIYFDARNFVK